MTSWKLDLNNNIQYLGDFEIVEDVESVKQDIKNILLMFQGEYPFDTRRGIAWFDLLSSNDDDLIKNAIINRILEDSRINSVTNITIAKEKGSLTFSANVLLKNGVLIDV